jgi:hypothetical protein
VTYIRNDVDRSRQECHEHLLSILREAIDLDFRFLLAKGDQAFQDFMSLMDHLFVNSFSLKLRLEAITIMQSFFLQYFSFPDTDFLNKQTYERNKL